MKQVVRVSVLSLIAVVFALTATHINAEDDIKVTRASDNMFKGEGFGGPIVSAFYIPSIASLNEKLQSLGYQQRFGEVLLGIGGQGFGYTGNVLMGGGGSVIISSSIEGKFNGTNVVATLSGSFGFFEFGYAVIKAPNFEFAPILGIGGGGYTLSFKSKSEAYDFDTIAKNPYSYANGISYGDFSIEVGILTYGKLILSENIIQLCDDLKIKSYSTVGLILKASYIFSIIGNDDSIISEPSFGDHTISLGLSITFGGKSEKL
ncbi:MAG: hypothetical protein N3D81_06340 [Spirochaetes bacterium]|nr:hypothetical protein [Spirochaetota bacterium]